MEKGGNLVLLGQCGAKDQYNLAQNEIPLVQAMGDKVYPSKKVIKTIGNGKIIYLPLAVPPSKFLILAKSGQNVTTFGPSMADVFADIPEGYTRGRIDPGLLNYLSAASDEISALLDGKMTRLVDGTRYLEISTMRQTEKDLLLVHLVNYDVVLDGTITPAEDVEIQILIPDGKKVKNISYSGNLGQMQSVAFKEMGRMVSLRVPKIDIYGLALIEF